MKKVLFIIPDLKLYTAFKFLLLLILLLFKLNVIAINVYGCNIIAGSTNRLYYTPYLPGGGSPTAWIATGAGRGGYNTFTNSRCFDNVGPSCTVYKFGSTGTTAAEILYSGGVYANLYDCPIDDYIPTLFIFTISIAFFSFRSRQ